MNNRARRYKKLLRQVAKELNEQPNSEIVKHVSTFRLLRESLQIRLLEGQHVDPADLLKIDEALKRYVPQGKPLSVQLKIVKGITGICPKCKAHIEDYVAPPKPAQSLPPVIDGEVVKPEPAEASPKPPAPPPRRNPGSIHDAVLPDGTPARQPKVDQSWKGHVDSGNGSYDVFKPAPDCGVAHVLPTPPRKCFGN